MYNKIVKVRKWKLLSKTFI